MTTTSALNVAGGNARVGVQASVVHGDIHHYDLPPDATPEDHFRLGVSYLDARVRDEARTLIEKAAANGYITSKVQFYRLLALLSGRTLRQLSGDEFDQLFAISADLKRLDDRDRWAAGVRVIARLLTPQAPAESELVIKEVDALPPGPRELVYSHLEALLEGAVQDEMWQRSVAHAEVRRRANRRTERVWKFFHPTPERPRTRVVRPAEIPLREWARVLLSTALFGFAVGRVTTLLTAEARLGPLVGLLTGLVGLVAFCVGGADRHFRQTRLRAKDDALRPPRQRRDEAPADGFARQMDRLFDRYFRRYVPEGTSRDYWLAQTAGIRRQLRDELVEIYRESRIKDTERIAWLVRYLVGDVKARWKADTLTAHRHLLRVPTRTNILQAGGVAALVVGFSWLAPAVLRAEPLAGTGFLLLAVASALVGVPSAFRITAERRRVVADEAERADQDKARWAAYHRWTAKLSDKPTDTEMAAWLEYDRKVLVDRAMRACRLRPSQVIAHAFIEAPARSYKRARYPRGPWRYSHYRLLLFLLTQDGVRQVNFDLDFEAAEEHMTDRLNYRFDAVAAVRVDGIATQRQTFELMLFNGDPISVPVTECDAEGIGQDEDPARVTKLSLDASGLGHTLHVLEGVAAEGKEWVRHRRRQADERLADLADALRDHFG